MTMTLNGSGSITGLSAGGLPDSTIQTADIVDASVTQAKLATNVAATGPAFYAYASSATAMSANTRTLVIFQTELFDTNSNYDTSTGRFTPTVAGYYFLASTIRYDATGNVVTHMYIEHSSLGTVGTGTFLTTTQNQSASHASTVAYFNGTTDYAFISPYVNAGGNCTTGQGVTYFTGYLVRAA